MPPERREGCGGGIQQHAPSDEDLIAAFLAGEEAAFDLLFARHRDGVLSYCYRLLRSSQEAEEVCVEAFSRLFEGHRPDRFRPWIFTVAHRLCVDHLRRRDRHRRFLVALPAPSEPVSPEEAAGRSERLESLTRAVDTLPVEHRSAVLLYYGQGLTSREVADILGLRHDQARSRIAYACRLLRQRLSTGDDHER